MAAYWYGTSAVLVTVLVLAAAPVEARRMPRVIDVTGMPLELNGAGERSVLFFVDLYAAGL